MPQSVHILGASVHCLGSNDDANPGAYPLVTLLGYTKPIAKSYRKYLDIALIMAKRRVAYRWGRGRAPKFKEWLTDLLYCQEQLTHYADLLPRASRPRDV